MKKIAIIVVAALAVVRAQAQLLSPEAFSGATFGALIGGIAGGDSHHHGCHSYYELSSDGAAIGAGIGLLTGALLGEARRQSEFEAPHYVYAPAPAPVVNVGYGYTHSGSSVAVSYSQGYYAAPASGYRSSRPNYALGGTLLGAASGALIGEGSSGKPAEGAAIGAGAGLVLGAIAEQSAQKRGQKAATQTRYAPAPQARTSASVGGVSHRASMHSQNQITSRPAPNSTYYWTAPPKQIPDAPFVPNAPTF